MREKRKSVAENYWCKLILKSCPGLLGILWWKMRMMEIFQLRAGVSRNVRCTKCSNVFEKILATLDRTLLAAFNMNREQMSEFTTVLPRLIQTYLTLLNFLLRPRNLWRRVSVRSRREHTGCILVYQARSTGGREQLEKVSCTAFERHQMGDYTHKALQGIVKPLDGCGTAEFAGFLDVRH